MEIMLYITFFALLAVVVILLFCNQRQHVVVSKKEQEYQQKIIMQTVSMRDLYFSRVTGGGYYQNVDELLAGGKDVGVEFPYGNYILLLAQLETWGELFENNRSDRQSINFILRNVLENSFSGTTHAADLNGAMVAVLNFPDIPDGGTHSIAQDARHSLEVLESEFGLTVTIAISRFYCSPLELHRAYDDACRVMEFNQLLEDDSPVTCYEELTFPHVGAAEYSYLDLEQQLLQCVKHSDFARMRKIMHEMISIGFGSSAATVDTVRFRIYGAVNLLLYLADELRPVVGHQVIDEIDPGPRLTQAQTLSQIVAVIDDIFDALEQHMAAKQRNMASPWVEEIPEYIEDNFRNPDINVSSIADYFGVSTTYCSRLFKERYHIMMKDAIQKLRLDAAKELLLTDLSLPQIAEQSGFGCVLTLSRAFKRSEGVSPGQYRIAHRK